MNAIQISNVAIRQNANGLFSLNDLHKAAGGANKHQPNRFLRNEQTQDLINEISRYPNLGNALETKRGGSNQGTYVCKQLVIAYGMWINATFALQVINCFLSQAEKQPETLPETKADDLLTPEQCGYLYTQVNEIARRTGRKHATIWRELKSHFKVATYREIKRADFPAACRFLDIPLPIESKQEQENFEKVPVIYPKQGSIPFNLVQDATYVVRVCNGKLSRSAMMFASIPHDDQKIPALQHNVNQ